MDEVPPPSRVPGPLQITRVLDDPLADEATAG